MFLLRVKKEDMQIKPKNWATFQHYKERCPPWVKLHRDLLNDREFMCLPIASKAIAPLMWLLASESKDGSFDGSQDELMFRLHISLKEYNEGVKPLITKGFFVVDSTMLADGKQDAIPETETETETKREKERERKKSTIVDCPPDVSEQVWEDWVNHRKSKNATVTKTVLNGAIAESAKLNWTLEQFLIEWCLQGTQGFKAEWVQQNTKRFNQPTTVPSKPGLDPTLAKIIAENLTTKPPSEEIRRRLQELRRKE